jgi:hypothetical protein
MDAGEPLFRERVRFPRSYFLVNVLFLLVLNAIFAFFVLPSFPTGLRLPLVAIWLVLMAFSVVLGLGYLWRKRHTTTVSAEGVTIEGRLLTNSLLSWPTEIHFDPADIETVSANPFSHGLFSGFDTAIAIRGKDGVIIETTDGSTVYVSADRPVELEGAIESILE